MIETLSFLKRVSHYFIELPFVKEIRFLFDELIQKISFFFSSIRVPNQQGLYIRYLMYLFVLIILFLFLKVMYKALVLRGKIYFFHTSTWNTNSLLFKKDLVFYQTLKQHFQNDNLLVFIMQKINEGETNSKIVQSLPDSLPLIDSAPLVEAVRFFKTLAREHILSKNSKEKRAYARAIKDFSCGKMKRAVNLMRKELLAQQKSIFMLKNKLIKKYASKEASKIALHLAVILGFYDVHLSRKAYMSAMKLNPDNQKARILFGRFQERFVRFPKSQVYKYFMDMSHKIDSCLEIYFLEYLSKMMKKSQRMDRLSYLKEKIQDDKEKYLTSLQEEGLKLRERIKMEHLKNLALSGHIRLN